jgi:type VI secretion system protein ImpF
MRYAPSLLDKLINSSYTERPGQILTGLTLSELIHGVAQDLEALLNTHSSLRGEDLARYPLSAGAVCNFGIPDFSLMCLASNVDQDLIRKAIKAAIENQERRLSNVVVTIDEDDEKLKKKRFVFSIQAVLRVTAAQQPVSFDAHFEPTAQRYSVVNPRAVGRS